MTKSAWLQRIEKWNFAVALLVLASLFAYFSPLADPFRISVSDQMARLESKRISAEKFDLAELRWEGGRFGKAALERLVKSTDHALANRASEQLTKRSRYDGFTSPSAPEKAIAVYPKGKKLPQSFINVAKQPENETFSKADCLRVRSQSCDAFLIDFDQDGRDEILIISNGSVGEVFVQSTIWKKIGWLSGRICPEDIAALKAGAFELQANLPKYRAPYWGVQQLDPRAHQSADLQQIDVSNGHIIAPSDCFT